MPIVVDGRLVGGIGVSGGHWSDDVKIAEAALTAITTASAG
ncbi:heme-binding protein [Streptomyces roseus]